MNIAALLSWFDESPAQLARCVASIARFADHLVAVDGRYELYRAKWDVSPVEQHEALLAAAEGAGLTYTSVRQGPWPGEVEKRNATIELARTAGADWAIVIDADEYVSHVSPDFRHRLENTPEHVGCYRLTEMQDLGSPQLERLAREHIIQAEGHSQPRSIYRMLPDLAYEGTHYHVAATIDGRKQWLWGQSTDGRDLAPLADMSPYLHVAHLNRQRPIARRNSAADYYRLRDQVNAEVTPIGAPDGTRTTRDRTPVSRS